MSYSEINDVYNSYLEHYGVLGMKWGVRKDRTSNNSSSEKMKKKIKARKKVIKGNKKNRYGMTDAQLDKEINRLKKEKEVLSLSKDVLKNGKIKTDSMLKSIGKTTLKGVGVAAAGYGTVKIATSKPVTKKISTLIGNSNMKQYDTFIKEFLIPAVKPKRK